MKSDVANLEYGAPVFLFLRKQTRLLGTRGKSYYVFI